MREKTTGLTKKNFGVEYERKKRNHTNSLRKENFMLKILTIALIFVSTSVFAAGKPTPKPKAKPSYSSNSRTSPSTKSEFYGPKGGRVGSTTQSGKTTRYWGSNGKYLGKEVKQPK